MVLKGEDKILKGADLSVAVISRSTYFYALPSRIRKDRRKKTEPLQTIALMSETINGSARAL